MVARTQAAVHGLARRGLRTLVFGARALSADEAARWKADYAAASADLHDPDAALSALARKWVGMVAQLCTWRSSPPYCPKAAPAVAVPPFAHEPHMRGVLTFPAQAHKWEANLELLGATGVEDELQVVMPPPSPLSSRLRRV